MSLRDDQGPVTAGSVQASATGTAEPGTARPGTAEPDAAGAVEPDAAGTVEPDAGGTAEPDAAGTLEPGSAGTGEPGTTGTVAPGITREAGRGPTRAAASAARATAGGLRPRLLEALVLAGFLAAGIAATWPRAAYLTGRLPFGQDQAEYVWNMWWVAHQVTHLGNPWSTGYLAAPVGIQLGFDTLTPLLGVVFTPVTVAFGPAAAYNLLAIVMPGLAGYAMWRVARLWLPGLIGPLAAGALYGLSGMLAFQDWYHLHTAAGCVFLPLTLETAVRLRRAPAIGRGVIFGVVLGASMLVDQEFSVVAVILAALALVPWLAGRPGAAAYRALATGAVTSVLVAAPQLAVMAAGLAQGHANPGPGQYAKFAGELPGLFAPNPRIAGYGLGRLAIGYRAHTPTEALVTFGVVLTVLAVTGLVVSGRRRSARLLALLWLGSAAVALGPTLYLAGRQYVPLAQFWHGQQVSLLMPDTWLIRVPGLTSFREPDRFTLLGLVGAALLAGAAAGWLARRSRLLLAGAALLAALEAGWPGPAATMPTALPAVDGPIAADRSGSIVVDVPFGIKGIPWYGKNIAPAALVLATADGHPRGDSYTSWVPRSTLTGIRRHAFYAGLTVARLGQRISPARLAAARQDLTRLHVGWVLVWTRPWMAPGRPHARLHYDDIARYLSATGFRLGYRADGVEVYRPGE